LSAPISKWRFGHLDSDPVLNTGGHSHIRRSCLAGVLPFLFLLSACSTRIVQRGKPSISAERDTALVLRLSECRIQFNFEQGTGKSSGDAETGWPFAKVIAPWFQDIKLEIDYTRSMVQGPHYEVTNVFDWDGYGEPVIHEGKKEYPSSWINLGFISFDGTHVTEINLANTSNLFQRTEMTLPRTICIGEFTLTNCIYSTI